VFLRAARRTEDVRLYLPNLVEHVVRVAAIVTLVIIDRHATTPCNEMSFHQI